MNYRVIVAPEAYAALEAYIDYVAVEKQAPLNAARWLDKALAALKSLQTFPHRRPLAPENDHCRETIRMLIVDRCLFLYRVDDDARTVRVLDFRHGSQQPRPLSE